ncbi:MAG: hypothetical protein ACREB9_00705 [Thermoplasmata archaeon]
MAASPPNLVLGVGPQATQLLATYTVAASAPAGTIVTGTISAFGPLVGASASIQVPISEVWQLVRTSITGAPAIDATLITLINGVAQNFYPSLSSLNENLLHPFSLPQSIPFPPASTVATSIDTLGANGSTPVTMTVKYWVVRAPYTG